jgi:hypothetical protein
MTLNETMDVPFTQWETLKWLVSMLLVPWVFWLPLLWFGAFVRTFPSPPPSYLGLWLTPTVLTIAYMISWIMLIDRPRVVRERMQKSQFHGGNKPGEPREEKQAQIILMIETLVVLFGSCYDAKR